MKTDVEIAQEAVMQPITQIAKHLEIPEDDLELYGKYKAKISLNYWNTLKDRQNGKLILVTAINPTPAGEGKTTTSIGLGKTTTSIGLGDALHRLGKKTTIALREPSLGPCFGLKGGAAGGGYAQVVPMEDINLHFTGDFHAITTAHNLLAAVIDNHIQQGNALDLDVRRITWKRAMRSTSMCAALHGSAYSTSTTAHCATSSAVSAAKRTAYRAKQALTSPLLPK